MLTSEQTAIRLRDAEITRLRKENERLTHKAKEVKEKLIALIRFVAKDMPYSYKLKALSLADELENEPISNPPPTTQQKGE